MRIRPLLRLAAGAAGWPVGRIDIALRWLAAVLTLRHTDFWDLPLDL